MSGLLEAAIWLVSVAGYLAGWTATTVVGARWDAANRAYCHREGSGYKWSQPIECRRFDRRGCWRKDDAVGVQNVARAAAPSLIWPIAIIAALAFVMATRKPLPGDLQRRIEELERENGIGA